MTMLKAPRYNIDQRHTGAEAAPEGTPEDALRAATEGADASGNTARNTAPPAGEDDPTRLFDNATDGFGDMNFPTARAEAPPQPSQGEGQTVEEAIAAIRAEGLTGRQLRTARRLAQRHNLPATSDFDAVRLLREAGIDPFQKKSVLDLGADTVRPAAEGTGTSVAPLPGDGVKLPQTVKPIQLPSTEQRAEVNHAAEILRMQQDIARRRRRRVALLLGRLFVFILLPTLIAAWYFAFVATPLYATKSEFQIQLQDPPSAGGIGGLLSGTSAATMQDSIAVQGYLQSREAMLQLEKDISFRKAFQGEQIDPILRLPDDATQEGAYKLYKRYVVISYDPTEGIIRMEVSAPDPQLSAEWSRQLIKYAEQQVDQMTVRLREDAMSGARESYQDAEKNLIEAQQRVVDLQEAYKVLSSELEVSLLSAQIGTLESQLTTERLALAQMEANPTPNTARMEPVRRRIETLTSEIEMLRKKLTEGDAKSQSLARIQGELMVAQADVETRRMIMAQSVQAMENARQEANRQTRYLTPSVSPIPPDEPSYPRVFENTLVTLLILLGIYLMVSMTIAIVREQVSA